MLLLTVKIFDSYPAVLETYQKQYRYIHVDEYQDTNHIQYQLVHLLSNTHKNICVVGDFDQTIYSWRGAKVENILNFEKDFQGAKTIKLEENYRSTHFILNAANGVIEHNTQRKPKKLWTQNKSGDPITHYFAADTFDECKFIVDTIHTLEAKEKNISYNDIAILYRTNTQSRQIEETFNFQQIPCKVIGSQPFYERQEIRDLIAYLKLALNPDDSIAFTRAISRPSRRIGKTSLDKIQMALNNEEPSVFKLIRAHKAPVSGSQTITLESFFTMISAAKEAYDNSPKPCIGNLLETLLVNSGYKQMLENSRIIEDKERLENIQEFQSICKETSLSLSDFIENIALMSDHDHADQDVASISLMTLHHAKGLEFKAVFIIGFEEGLMPYYKTATSPSELEEERRLCYVGYTRAKKYLYLVGAYERQLFGDTWKHGLSQFIKETPKDTFNFILSPKLIYSDAKVLTELNEAGIRYHSPKKSTSKPIIKAERVAIDVSIGDIIMHKVWGQGQILKLEGEGDKLIYHISFNGEVRKLMAKYSPVSKVESA